MTVAAATRADAGFRRSNAVERAFPWLLTLLWLISATTLEAASSEYQVKAAFLYNFAQFVDWPSTAFASAQAPLVIGILGDDPFGSVLDETIRGEIIGNRPLLIHRYLQLEQVDTCHILFISRSEINHLDSIVGRLRSRGILTVGDLDNFAQRGGMIQFTTEANKIRLRINLAAARRASLTISSKLLRPAEVIGANRD